MVSFVRPDIAVFPRGMEFLQIGHYIFVANCKTYVHRIKQMYMGHPRSKKRELKAIREEIENLKRQKEDASKADDFYMCLKLAEDLKKAEARFIFVKYKIEVGKLGWYTFKHTGSEPVRIKVLACYEEAGKVDITKVDNKSKMAVEVNVERLGVHLASYMKTVHVCNEKLSFDDPSDNEDASNGDAPFSAPNDRSQGIFEDMVQSRKNTKEELSTPLLSS